MSVLPAIIARPHHTRPQLLDGGSIEIYHPNYPQGMPILKFQVYPSSPDNDGVVGFPLGVVLDACFVVAKNQPGELHVFGTGVRVAGADSDPDGLLVPGTYDFVVVQEGGVLDYNYLLCPSFSVWTPPVEIPTRWKGGEPATAPPLTSFSDVSSAVKTDDKTCIMTGASTSLQASHLVPEAESDWFASNYQLLKGYGGDPSSDLNSERNLVTLRADMEGQGFDQGLFLFAPYADHVVAVFVMPIAQDLAHQYHLRRVDFPARIRRGYLFARFAWIVLNFLTPGLANAVVAMSPLEEHTDDMRILKRKKAPGTGSGTKKSKRGDTASGGNGGGVGGGGGDGDEPEDEEELSERQSHSSTEDEDEAQLAIFETLDAALKDRPLTIDDIEAGRYHGYSAVKRRVLEYMRANPQISAVGNRRFWANPDDRDSD
ncbi:hypothetical protein C8F01DRAFT_1120630 [Mycena amicta]|nr:hypothetical protein C8F01DRAFT_1120630 [Mycena amicta]